MEKLKDIDVYLLAGQSNAVGCTKLSTLPDGFVPEVFEGIHLYQEGNFGRKYYGKWTDFVTTGMGCRADQMGIEYGMAKVLHSAGKQAALLRYALGGSSLYGDWLPRTRWEGEPQFLSQHGFSYRYWSETVYRGLNKLIENGYSPVIRAFLWMQGEQDAFKSEQVANEYFDNLSALIYNVRTELRIPDLTAIIGEIAVTKETCPWADAVRKAERDFVKSDKNAVLVSTNGVPIGTDGLHFDAPEDIELGKRFGKAILDIQGEN